MDDERGYEIIVPILIGSDAIYLARYNFMDIFQNTIIVTFYFILFKMELFGWKPYTRNPGDYR